MNLSINIISVRKYEIIREEDFAKIYNRIKEQNPGIKDKDVANILNISAQNLFGQRRRISE